MCTIDVDNNGFDPAPVTTIDLDIPVGTRMLSTSGSITGCSPLPATGPAVVTCNMAALISLGNAQVVAVVQSSTAGVITLTAIMGLLPPPAVRVTGGQVFLGKTDLIILSENRMRDIRGNRIAMIFQEPMTSLNPVMNIGNQLIEAIMAHDPISRKKARTGALQALTAVRLSEPDKRMSQYPHELSGGMRQRVMIAMAIALRPDVLIADEPTTALDVTVQREVLDLLRDLQRDMGTAMILITHDMGS